MEEEEVFGILKKGKILVAGDQALLFNAGLGSEG